MDTRASRELRLGRRVSAREGCLAEGGPSNISSAHASSFAISSIPWTRVEQNLAVPVDTNCACWPSMSDGGKHTVYVLRSDADRTRHYVGVTSNLRDRLDRHNHGP